MELFSSCREMYSFEDNKYNSAVAAQKNYLHKFNNNNNNNIEFTSLFRVGTQFNPLFI
jgi:hypothetical protein